VTKTYDRDGDYEVAVRALDDLGKESVPQKFPLKLDHDRRERDAAAAKQKAEDSQRAIELETKKRAAEEAARLDAEKRIVEEAAEKARKDAEAATRKRLAEEAEKAEEDRKAAEAAAQTKAARQQQQAAEAPTPKQASAANAQEKTAAQQTEPSEFKDVTSGRPVRPISFKKPSYPRDALSASQEGSVRVQFTVNTKGTTKDLKVIAQTNGHYFQSSVLDAIKRATFKPAVIDGAPVEQQLVYEVSFVINKD
jgi:TonB family protein